MVFSTFIKEDIAILSSEFCILSSRIISCSLTLLQEHMPTNRNNNNSFALFINAINNTNYDNPEDVEDVFAIMESGKWNIESIITDEYPWEQLPLAIERAADVEHALNVVIHY